MWVCERPVCIYIYIDIDVRSVCLRVCVWCGDWPRHWLDGFAPHNTRHKNQTHPAHSIRTLYPRSDSSSAADRPASPPPTTATRRSMPRGRQEGASGFLYTCVLVFAGWLLGHACMHAGRQLVCHCERMDVRTWARSPAGAWGWPGQGSSVGPREVAAGGGCCSGAKPSWLLAAGVGLRLTWLVDDVTGSSRRAGAPRSAD